jgi:hypothetical protein
MITVAVMHSEVAIEVLEGGVFDPVQTAILKLAYDRAAQSLAIDHHLSEHARIKLAKIVLRMGRLSLEQGKSLSREQDVQGIGVAARAFLLSLNANVQAGQPVVHLLADRS